MRICAVSVVALTVVLGSSASHGQTRPPVPRIAFLSFFPRLSAPLSDPLEIGFQQGLRELGLVEGQGVAVERRYANFRLDQLVAMTEELVRLKVIDKILRRVPAGDIPIEGPTKFELALNLKTAKIIGIVFPQSLLLRADRVVE